MNVWEIIKWNSIWKEENSMSYRHKGIGWSKIEGVCYAYEHVKFYTEDSAEAERIWPSLQYKINSRLT